MTPKTLFHYWRSSSSWRVRWALEIKGLKPEMVHVNLLDGESEAPTHLKRNPMGFVPVLEASPGKYLIESVAIFEFLEELVPSPQLYPGDAYKKAHIRSLVEIINSGIQPLGNLSTLDHYSEDEEKRKEWSRFFIKRGLHAYEDLIKKTAGKFSVGDEITAADLFLIPQLYNALRVGLNLSDFRILEKINQNALATPAGMASVPERYKPN
jgi:maleylacetoacetate isomerase